MKPSDKDLAIASASVIAYTALMTLAGLTGDGTAILIFTAIAGIWLYACYQIDRAEKARDRVRDAQRRKLDEAIKELEEWREQREAD